jgi:hypothetical protein
MSDDLIKGENPNPDSHEELSNSPDSYVMEKVIAEEYCTAFIMGPILYIKWHANPTDLQVKDYFKKLQEVFSNASTQLYSLSDISKGKIDGYENIGELIRFITLNKKSWKGGSMFNGSKELGRDEKINYEIYKAVADTDSEDGFYTTFQEAIAHLIRINPDLESFPWGSLLPSAKKLSDES